MQNVRHERWFQLPLVLSRVLATIAGLAILLSIIILLREAAGRYFFNQPTEYAYAAVSFIVVAVLYLSLAYTAANGGHVSSDVVFDRLPAQAKLVVLLVSEAIAVAIGTVLTVQMSHHAWRSLSTGAVIPDLFNMPLAAAHSVVVVGTALFVVVSLAKFMRNLIALRSSRQISAKGRDNE